MKILVSPREASATTGAPLSLINTWRKKGIIHSRKCGRERQSRVLLLLSDVVKTAEDFAKHRTLKVRIRTPKGINWNKILDSPAISP